MKINIPLNVFNLRISILMLLQEDKNFYKEYNDDEWHLVRKSTMELSDRIDLMQRRYGVFFN